MIFFHSIGKINTLIPNLTVILVLVPLFLIISSSVYPAIISTAQNKDMAIISKVLAQQKQSNHGTSSYQSTKPLSSSQGITPTSPTPIEPTSSATPSTFKESTTMQQQQHEDAEMDATAISEGDAVHVIWSDTTSGSNEIFYKRDGADFDPTTINLSNNAGASFGPVIAVSGNNIHVAWEDDTPGNNEIFYRRSIDGGATFGPIINLSENAERSSGPAIAVSGNNIYVVWHDLTPGNFDVFYKRSTNGGATFTEPIKNLSSNTGNSFNSAIAASGNNVHVVWQDDTNPSGIGDIFYRRSTDSGAIFPNIIKNLSSNFSVSEAPAIAALGNNVHVVWDDFTPGNLDILYRRSLDGGNTFPNVIKNLSGNVGDSQRPSVAVSGSIVHIAWDDDTPGITDIFYKRSTDGGATFVEPTKNLSSNAGDSARAIIALSGNNVYVVWDDFTSGNFDILYRTSSDNGSTFPSMLTNLSANAGSSFSPAIAAS